MALVFAFFPFGSLQVFLSPLFNSFTCKRLIYFLLNIDSLLKYNKIKKTGLKRTHACIDPFLVVLRLDFPL